MHDFTGTPGGEKISPELNTIVERALEALPEAAGAALAAAPSAIGESLRMVFAASDFVAHACARDSQLVPQLLASGELHRVLRRADYAARAPVHELVGAANDHDIAVREPRRAQRSGVGLTANDAM